MFPGADEGDCEIVREDAANPPLLRHHDGPGQPAGHRLTQQAGQGVRRQQQGERTSVLR